jgi:hypothetical protein
MAVFSALYPPQHGGRNAAAQQHLLISLMPAFSARCLSQHGGHNAQAAPQCLYFKLLWLFSPLGALLNMVAAQQHLLKFNACFLL